MKVTKTFLTILGIPIFAGLFSLVLYSTIKETTNYNYYSSFVDAKCISENATMVNDTSCPYVDTIATIDNTTIFIDLVPVKTYFPFSNSHHYCISLVGQFICEQQEMFCMVNSVIDAKTGRHEAVRYCPGISHSIILGIFSSILLLAAITSICAKICSMRKIRHRSLLEISDYYPAFGDDIDINVDIEDIEMVDQEEMIILE
uniref:Uncharacterized protein n=1 Tax=Pithovirus LCPAC404 TaxID=2506597 RepID=A0A481ZC66_9VIRU|nr:MAG: hypothetical protein LCPAC404_00810 [Pithovirus LCPAC404]